MLSGNHLETQNSGPRLVPSPDHGQFLHSVQFYETDAYLASSTADHLSQALDKGDSVVAVAAKLHADEITTLLMKDAGARAAIEEGRCLRLDARITLDSISSDGWPDRAKFQRVIGPVLAQALQRARDGRGVVVFGEMVALLTAQRHPQAALELERLWNELAQKQSFALLCAYPIDHFSSEERGEAFEQVCAEHSLVLPTEAVSSPTATEAQQRNIALLQQKAKAQEAVRASNQELRAQLAQRQQAERGLEETEQSLRHLSRQLLHIQDEERRQLGRDLHDTVGQYLAAIKMDLESVASERREKGERTDARLTRSVELAEKAMAEIRRMSYSLYPPLLEEAGLPTAVAWYVHGFAKDTGIQVSLDISADFGRLPANVELTIYRLLQESLTNVRRHSGSRVASVHVAAGAETVAIVVSDKGKGLPAELANSAKTSFARFGVGMRGMEERIRQFGGTLRVVSSEGGTTISSVIPFSR